MASHSTRGNKQRTHKQIYKTASKDVNQNSLSVKNGIETLSTGEPLASRPILSKTGSSDIIGRNQKNTPAIARDSLQLYQKFISKEKPLNSILPVRTSGAPSLGSEHLRIALVHQMQKLHGNNAIQKIIQQHISEAKITNLEKIPLVIKSTTQKTNQINRLLSTFNHRLQLRQRAGLEPAISKTIRRSRRLTLRLQRRTHVNQSTRATHGNNPNIQRISLSDLNPLEAAKKLAEKAWGFIKNLGSSAWNTATDLGSKAWDTAKSAGSSAWGAIKNTGTSIWNTAKSLGTRAWDGAKNLGSRAWSAVKSAGSNAWNWAKGIGSKVWNGAKNLGSKAWNWAKDFGGRVWNGAKSMGSRLWSTAKSWGGEAWSAVKSGVSKAWKTIKAFGGKVWQTVKGLANKAWEGAKKWGGKAWDLAKKGWNLVSLDNLCKAVAWLVEKAYNLIAPYAKAAWEWVKKWGGKAWEAAKKLGSKLWETVKKWTNKIKELAKRALDKAINTVKNLARRAWDNAKKLGNKLINGAKRLGSKAWNWAKSMGSKAWNGAKNLANKVWNLAKTLGGKAIDAAKRLGTAAWEKAKALGSKLWESAKGAASKLLGIADKLTGGMASKIAGMAQRILDKAAGLLSWVFNKARDLANRALDTAKRWASKALETAKSWASKTWDTAKNLASKAWETAKSWAGKAWDTAKSWASKAWDTAKAWSSKAIETAKTWASKAWDTAKTWASKAWETAKSWAGKAWDTAKTWASKAWSAIKGVAGKVWSGVKWLGGKAWDFAKWMGGKALDFAKKIGLDKAWNWVKDKAGKAFKLAKDAISWIWKRIKPIVNTLKPIAEVIGKAALILNPTTLPFVGLWAGCKTLACLMPKLMGKGSTSQKATDIATDLTPVVSTVKDGCGCLTGQNMITGEEIGGGERAVRCTVAAIDIASYVGALFSEGGTAVAEQAGKGAIRAWLERLFKIGGKELTEAGEKEIAKQFAKLSEKELAEALAKMGEKELKELAEQATKAGEKDLAEKIEKELAKKLEKDTAEKLGEKVLAESPTAEGHTIQVKPGGVIEMCSPPPCPNIGLVYREVLDQNPELAKAFKEIQSRAQQAEKLIASGDENLIKQGEILAQEVAGDARRLQNKLAEIGVQKGGIRFRPEPDLLGKGRHGLEWGEAEALNRALRTGKPQGKFGSLADIQYAIDQAATLGPGKEGFFPLPAGSNSYVFLPDGNKIKATQIFVKVRANGSVHAYPL
jgi:phage-related protein